jgi:hypothetical protein
MTAEKTAFMEKIAITHIGNYDVSVGHISYDGPLAPAVLPGNIPATVPFSSAMLLLALTSMPPSSFAVNLAAFSPTAVPTATATPCPCGNRKNNHKQYCNKKNQSML